MAFTGITTSNGPETSDISSILASLATLTPSTTNSNPLPSTDQSTTLHTTLTHVSLPHVSTTDSLNSPTSTSSTTPTLIPHHAHLAGPIAAGIVGCLALSSLLFLFGIYLFRRRGAQQRGLNFEIVNGKHETMSTAHGAGVNFDRHPAFAGASQVDVAERETRPVRFKSLNSHMLPVSETEESVEEGMMSARRGGEGMRCERYG